MDGLLIVDKPAGRTSSDVVLYVKRLLRAKRVGHTGTLDPLATGVLPLCLGKATRLAQFLTDADKSYRAELRLGQRTDTGDAEGRVVEERPVPTFDDAALEKVLAGLRGEQLQTPPMYSAVKVGGERLYELARRGEEVERKARPIRVHRLAFLGRNADRLTLEVDCSKGTYVRVLAEDIGAGLGCGAHLTALRRLRSAGFGLEDAISLQALEALAPAERVRQLLPLERAVAHLPQQKLEPREAEGVRHGRVPAVAVTGLVALLDPTGALLAIARGNEQGQLSLERVLTG